MFKVLITISFIICATPIAAAEDCFKIKCDAKPAKTILVADIAFIQSDKGAMQFIEAQREYKETCAAITEKRNQWDSEYHGSYKNGSCPQNAQSLYDERMRTYGVECDQLECRRVEQMDRARRVASEIYGQLAKKYNAMGVCNTSLFGFFDAAYDVTKEVIALMNERYYDEKYGSNLKLIISAKLASNLDKVQQLLKEHGFDEIVVRVEN